MSHAHKGFARLRAAVTMSVRLEQLARGRLHPQAASRLNSGNFCEAYALDDRSAMNLTLTFTSAALLGGLLGALANYAPPPPRQRPVGTSNRTTPRPLEHQPRGGPGEHYDDVENIEEANQEYYERMEGYHNQLLKQDPYEPYHAKVAIREQGGVREGRSQWASRAQRGQSKASAPQTTPTSSTRTRPSPTSRTSKGSTTTTRSSPTTLAQQGGATHMDHGAGQGDEVSWMAVSNNNPPTRGTTRLGPPTTTTTSVPPPPPPMFQEEDTPLPPPLQPDMLLNMGYPQGTTWVLEEGVWQPIFPGEAQGAPASQAASPQQYHSGWSIFAAGDSGHTGSASSQGGQHTTEGNPEVTGHQHNHQQPQPQQPRHLPREAVNRGTAPAATNQWNSGWSPAHHNHNHAQHSQPQHPQNTAQGRGTWGYAATAAPSNGPWRPRYAPVYDPHTDPWHEDEEDDPLPTLAQSYPQTATQGGGTGAQQQWGQAHTQHPPGQAQPWQPQWQGGQAQGGHHQVQQAQAPHSQQGATTHTQVTVLSWQQQQALIQGSATYQANRLSAIQAQQARAGGANKPPQQSQPHPATNNPPGVAGPHPSTQGGQAGPGQQPQQQQQQQPRLIPEELEKIKEHKRMKAQEQAEAPGRRWGQATADHQGRGSEQQPQQDPPQQEHGDDNQEVPEQVPELEEACEPQGGHDQQQGQCQGGASQKNYHEGQGDQRRGNKATKSDIREEFRKRGLHKPDSYTWNQVAHWVDMVPFDAEGDGGSQSPAHQQGGVPAPGDKETAHHRERYEARERGDLRHEQPRDPQMPPTQRTDAGATGDKATAEHRERYEARQRGDYSWETPARSTAQRRDTKTSQQRGGHGSHQADSAAGEEQDARPVSTRGGVAWWRGEDLQKLHDRDGVFNHFTYSWGGYSPPLTWRQNSPYRGPRICISAT